MNSTPITRLSRAVAWAPLFLALCVPAQAVAGVFSVTPVRIYMSPRDRAVAITVTNEGDTPLVLQADLNDWKQKPDGTDELTLTEDLILAPPIIKLEPKARQVVRLARLAPPDASRQLTYRFILREIPEAGADRRNIQVPIALALSMPVFITPPGAKRAVSCGVVGRQEGSIGVRCENKGNAYAQIREVELTRGEKRIAHFEGGVYVLPGAAKTIGIGTEGTVSAGKARLTVTFDDNEKQELDLSVP